jgi:hypothetical protein
LRTKGKVTTIVIITSIAVILIFAIMFAYIIIEMMTVQTANAASSKGIKCVYWVTNTKGEGIYECMDSATGGHSLQLGLPL